jgi:hypothetical protein
MTLEMSVYLGSPSASIILFSQKDVDKDDEAEICYFLFSSAVSIKNECLAGCGWST